MLFPSLSMAEIIPGLDAAAFGQIIWGSMPPSILNNISFLLSTAKAIGVLFIVYLAFLIVKAIIQTRQALRIKAIAANVESINQKLDTLVRHKNESFREKKK